MRQEAGKPGKRNVRQKEFIFVLINWLTPVFPSLNVKLIGLVFIITYNKGS